MKNIKIDRDAMLDINTTFTTYKSGKSDKA